MTRPSGTTLISGALSLVGIVVLILWWNVGPNRVLQARIPGLDRPAEEQAEAASRIPAAGVFVRGDGKPADISGEWPAFRGKNLDGMAADGIPLARQWPQGGPRKLWSAELGEGYAGPAVWSGRVYLLDYDRAASADAVRCLSLADGKEIWRFSYPVAVKRNHGMSRTVPAVTDQYLVTLGPKCQVNCLDPTSGERRWAIDLVRQFGTTVPPWYAGQCPLIDSGRVILAPAGPDALLIAVDCKTGQPVWKSPNPRAWKMTHVSVTPLEVAGRRMYVYCGSGGVAGVAADDGSLLWDTTDWKISIATVPSPVVLPGGRIFFSGGYNAGAVMMEVQKEGDKFVAKTLFKLKADRFGSTQHTPILLKDHLYGVREKDKEVVCLDLKGKQVWASGSQHRFGLGPYLIADGLMYVMDDDGRLAMAEASPAGYKQLAEAQVLDGHDAWGPMALVAGRLLVRDLTRMVCLDVQKPK